MVSLESGHIMALELAQSLTEINTRIYYWSKGGRCLELTILPLSYAECLEIWSPNLLEPSGPVQALMGLLYLLLSHSHEDN